METQSRFRTYRREAELARFGEAVILGETRVVSLRLGRFGAVWSRPAALTTVRGGAPLRTPVVDVTEIAVFAMLGAVLAAWAWVALRWLTKG